MWQRRICRNSCDFVGGVDVSVSLVSRTVSPLDAETPVHQDPCLSPEDQALKGLEFNGGYTTILVGEGNAGAQGAARYRAFDVIGSFPYRWCPISRPVGKTPL